jgi:hypothetical protein
MILGVASTADAGHVWCWTAPLQPDNRKMFYTGAVETTQSQYSLDNAFGDYVRQHYPRDATGPGQCKLYSSQQQASSYLSQYRENSETSDHMQIIDLSWTP